MLNLAFGFVMIAFPMGQCYLCIASKRYVAVLNLKAKHCSPIYTSFKIVIFPRYVRIRRGN